MVGQSIGEAEPDEAISVETRPPWAAASDLRARRCDELVLADSCLASHVRRLRANHAQENAAV